MADEKKMPPGRKGGTTFPRLALPRAVEYAKKLVGKTQTGPQPASTILPGVFGASSYRGGIKASALKQYGLLEGSTEAYSATKLAKSIAFAPPEELTPLLQEACLKPKVFGLMYETFHGDTVTIAKLKQQAGSAGVHVEEAEKCAELFVESAVHAQLAQRDGDAVTLIARGGRPSSASSEADSVDSDAEESSNSEGAVRDTGTLQKTVVEPPTPPDPPLAPASSRSVIQVNLTLDSSMDIDKLQKQLELLRRFGAI